MNKTTAALMGVVIAAAFAMPSRCANLDLRCVEVSSRADMEAIMAIPEWRRGANTNGITMSVCTGVVVTQNPPSGSGKIVPLKCCLLFRDVEFDKDGRLVRVSPICSDAYNLRPNLGPKLQSLESLAAIYDVKSSSDAKEPPKQRDAAN